MVRAQSVTSEPVAREIAVPTGERAPTVSRKRHDYAVVIGIDAYSHLRSLDGATRDARAFGTWLRDKYGGGLPTGNIGLVLSGVGRDAPEHKAIDDKLLSILRGAETRSDGRRLYFYFGGHGAMNPDVRCRDVALLLPSWSQDYIRLALSSQQYADMLCGSGLFEEVALFIDCCRSLVPYVHGFGPLIRDRWYAATAQATRTFVAHAAEATLPAYETTSTAEPHGMFTECLLSILQRPTRSGIHAHRLKELLEREVRDYAWTRHQVVQHPHVSNELHAESRFGQGRPASLLRRLVRLVSGEPALLRLELRFATRRGKVVIRDSTLTEAASQIVRKSSWVLRLAPGLYRIEGGNGEDPVCIRHDGQKAVHDV